MNLRHWFSYLAKQVKKTYPSDEDVKWLFPSREELVSKVEKITNATQLEAFVRGISDDMNEAKPQDGSKLKMNEKRRNDLSALFVQVISIEKTRPIYNAGKFTELLQSDSIQKALKNATIVESTIPDLIQTRSIDSKIIQGLQYTQIIQGWLPGNYRSVFPKLLYRATRDGKYWNTFHSRCDDKGPNSNHHQMLGSLIRYNWSRFIPKS